MTTIATTMPRYSAALSPESLAERFAAIFEQYEQPLYHYVLRMMSGNTEEAQDLTQDAFVKAYTGSAEDAGRSQGEALALPHCHQRLH